VQKLKSLFLFLQAHLLFSSLVTRARKQRKKEKKRKKMAAFVSVDEANEALSIAVRLGRARILVRF
jgi:preprotein translocase subunit YajC